MIIMTNTLVSGDPLKPSDYDMIAQTARVPVGHAIPVGWNVLSGNAMDSLIARVAYRGQIEGAL